jgi:creatinine amidohydrolase
VASVAGSLQRRGVAIVQVDMWRLAAKLGADVLTSDRSFGHADEACTSMVMALAPDAVRRDRMEAVEPTPGWAWDTYASYPEVMGFSAWQEVSAGGTVGDPAEASTKKGEVLIERTVEHVCELIRRISEARLRDVPKL